MKSTFTRSDLNYDDRKHVKHYNANTENGIITHYIYLDLITEGGLNRLLFFVKNNGGNMKMYPHRELICVEIKTQQKQ